MTRSKASDAPEAVAAWLFALSEVFLNPEVGRISVIDGGPPSSYPKDKRKNIIHFVR